jgi:hypothetical protein
VGGGGWGGGGGQEDYQLEDEDSVTAVISCPLIILSWHLWNFVSVH